VFDDYALPENYGYDEPKKQSYGAPPAPERPKMRVVPNPGEENYGAVGYAPPPVAAANEYGAASAAAQQAAQLAKTQPTVTPTSAASDIKALQRALGINDDGDWRGQTTTALRAKQVAAGLAQVDQTTPELWAFLIGGSEGLAEYRRQQKQAGIVGGIEQVTDIIGNIFKPSEQSIPPTGTQPVSNTGAPAPATGADWGKYALIGVGVLAIGFAVWAVTSSSNKE